MASPIGNSVTKHGMKNRERRHNVGNKYNNGEHKHRHSAHKTSSFETVVAPCPSTTSVAILDSDEAFASNLITKSINNTPKVKKVQKHKKVGFLLLLLY